MKKGIALLLAAAMTFSLAACGSKPSGGAASSAPEAKAESKSEAPAASQTEAPADKTSEAPKELIELNVAYMPNYASLWSVLTAIDKGYFEEEGLSVKLWEFADGPSEIAAMEGGSIDIAYIGHGAHKLCVEGKAKIFLPSSVHSTDRIILLTDHGLDKVEDLAGKKVAYNAGSSSETALNGALKVAGLTMDDIEAYEMDATNMVAAMMSGSVDACTAWNPYSSQILENCESAVELEFATDSVNLSSWICLPDYAKDNQDILMKFSRAIYKGMAYSSQVMNYDYAVGLYADKCAKDKEACQVETGDATWFAPDVVLNGLTDGSMKDLYERQQKMFLDAGSITQEAPVEDYVMLDLMQEALKSMN